MLEKETSVNNVVPFRTRKPKSPTLETLIQEDQEVRDFFKFVYENDLRLAALEALKARLSKSV
ncbi:MAG: hypothetical protein FJ112_07370 [Deltaproteobacteria bacterium]|nr:hypothetical protein [Deltaproteobacteria bacterium]